MSLIIKLNNARDYENIYLMPKSDINKIKLKNFLVNNKYKIHFCMLRKIFRPEFNVDFEKSRTFTFK